MRLEAQGVIPESITHLIDHLTPTQETDLYIAHFKEDRQRIVYVKYTKEGYRVDWDCYARYGTVPWEDILAARVSVADVRVKLVPSDHYVYRFRDESQWTDYMLYNEDIGTTIHGPETSVIWPKNHSPGTQKFRDSA